MTNEMPSATPGSQRQADPDPGVPLPRARLIRLTVACVSLTLLLVLLPSAAVQAGGEPIPTGEAHYLDGRVIVSYRAAPGPRAMVAAGGQYHALDVPTGMATDDYIAVLRRDPLVASVERDVLVVAARVPDDEYYTAAQETYFDDLNAPAGWELETGDGDIVIAVIDTGIDTGHPEVAGRLWVNEDEIAGNGIDDDNNGCVDDIHGCRILDRTLSNSATCGYTTSGRDGAIDDDHGSPSQFSPHHSHGTLVAGAAAARGNNQVGTTGAAWNAQIMVVKVLDCGADFGCPCGSMLNVAEAILYASRNGADIINLSLASTSMVDDIQALRDAILAARANGAVVVAATGNHPSSGANPGVGYPAAYAGTEGFDNVVAVASSDNTRGNVNAGFSNHGPEVTIAAPGISIAGPVRREMIPDVPYGADSGTSFSTALVSGLFALMTARNPDLSAAELIDLVRETATPAPPGPENWAGAGIANFGDALAHIPMTIRGNAHHDWKEVPGGAVIQARINTVLCAETQVQDTGTTAEYRLVVPPEAVKPGCGSAGARIDLMLDGRPVEGYVPWSQNDTPLAIYQDLSTTTPGPGLIVTQTLTPGWNNLAHLVGSGDPADVLGYLPGWEAAYLWDATAASPTGGWGNWQRAVRGVSWANTWVAIRRYDAFWVFVPEAETISVPNPLPAPGRVVQLHQGWNNLTYTGPTARFRDAFADIAGEYSIVASYDSDSRSWQRLLPDLPSYLNDFEAAHSLQTYWIYMTEPGEVRFD